MSFHQCQHWLKLNINHLADGLNGVQYTYADQVKAHWIVYEALMESQEEQILGVVHVGDFSGASASHVGMWKNPVEFLKLLKWGEQSVPLRHKAIHVYNIPTLLKYVVDAAKSITSTKMKDRIHVSKLKRTQWDTNCKTEFF